MLRVRENGLSSRFSSLDSLLQFVAHFLFFRAGLNSWGADIAAQQDHREACFALTAWYLVGSPGVLPQSDTEAYLWAKKAAGMGLAKAEYAVGYFTEVAFFFLSPRHRR